MKKRILKKYAKKYIRNLVYNKIPIAFRNDDEKEQFISAWGRSYVGQIPKQEALR